MPVSGSQPLYIVAVSGGVDSVVLLDMLTAGDGAAPKDVRSLHGSKFVVAHFDHGIRLDSGADRQFVQKLAETHNLPFEYDEGRLGSGASEAVAREVRYGFLRRLQQTYAATAIITAHHQDDVLETAVVNMLRGTNRRGMSSLASREGVLRPLLSYTKQELVAYATERSLQWREDSTNSDQHYLRNYVRHSILSKASATERNALIGYINSLARINKQIDAELEAYIHGDPEYPQLNRVRFIALPHLVAREVIAQWLRHAAMRSYDTKTLDRLVIGAKTLSAGSLVSVDKFHWLEISRTSLALIPTDR